MLTRRKAIQEHRKLWTWISQQTRLRKECAHKKDYFIEKGKDMPMEQCYCCEYSRGICMECPIEWGSEVHFSKCLRITGLDSDGLFMQWKNAVDDNDWRKASVLALAIANLPARKSRRWRAN